MARVEQAAGVKVFVKDPILRAFPLLTGRYRHTSPQTPDYNCIAWAAGDSTRFWWPRTPYYWPPGVARDETLAGFVAAYATLGYAPCDDGVFVAGQEKVALYGRPDKPLHAARQLETGKWTSKLGSSVDIEHDSVLGVCSAQYGVLLQILARKRARQSASK